MERFRSNPDDIEIFPNFVVETVRKHLQPGGGETAMASLHDVALASDLLKRCLQFIPDDRPRSMDAVISALSESAPM